MSAVSLSGSDTLILFGRVFEDVADGDFFTIEFSEDLAKIKRGKNGNAIYASNAGGEVGDSTLRLIRGSADDKFMNAKLAAQRGDFASTVLGDGQFTKRVGDGEGNITSDTYVVSGGIFKKMVGAKSNAEADTDQSVSIYAMSFADIERAIQ